MNGLVLLLITLILFRQCYPNQQNGRINWFFSHLPFSLCVLSFRINQRQFITPWAWSLSSQFISLTQSSVSFLILMYTFFFFFSFLFSCIQCSVSVSFLFMLLETAAFCVDLYFTLLYTWHCIDRVITEENLEWWRCDSESADTVGIAFMVVHWLGSEFFQMHIWHAVVMLELR